MALCAVCNTGVDSKSRRRLHGGNELALSVLDRVLHDVFRNSIESARITDAFLSESAFTCRPCFRRLEKLVKLKNEVCALESEIRNLVIATGEARGILRDTAPDFPKSAQLQLGTGDMSGTPLSR